MYVCIKIFYGNYGPFHPSLDVDPQTNKMRQITYTSTIEVSYYVGNPVPVLFHLPPHPSTN